MASTILWMREGVLAFVTGGVAGTAATYVTLQKVWQRASAQGAAADACVVELRDLRGAPSDETPRRQVRATKIGRIALA